MEEERGCDAGDAEGVKVGLHGQGAARAEKIAASRVAGS